MRAGYSKLVLASVVVFAVGSVMAWLAIRHPPTDPSARALKVEACGQRGLSGSSADVQSEAPSWTRSIRVRIAADYEFLEQEGWEDQIEEDVTFVSTLLTEQFHVRLDICDWRTWDSVNAGCVRELLEDVRRRVELDGADWILAFSGKEFPFSPGSYWYPDMGAAWNYGRHAALAFTQRGAGYRYRRETLLHEVLHLFGAWHSPSERSVMRIHPCGEPVYFLDSVTSSVLKRNVAFDFEKGVEMLSVNDISAITDEFIASRVDGEMHPVANALENSARTYLDRGDVDRAKACLRSAIVLCIKTEGMEALNTLRLASWLGEIETAEAMLSHPAK